MARAEHRRLIVCNASAGSGKTYTLVKEYLRIVLCTDQPDKFHRVLAMTFTNKAASEMKERIIRSLKDLSTSREKMSVSQKRYFDEITHDFSIEEKTLSERAGNLLKLILHQYDSFHVMTIDKFTHRVIRSFARDLNLSLDFDVELDIATLQSRMTDQLFREIGVNDAITSVMLHYASSRVADEQSWDFSQSVKYFSSVLFRENSLAPLERLSDMTQEMFIEERKNRLKFNHSFEKRLVQEGLSAMNLIESNGLGAMDFIGKTKGVFSFLQRIARGEIVKPSKTVLENSARDNWGHSDSANINRAIQISPELKAGFQHIELLLETDYSVYILNQEILKNLNNLSLLNHLSTIINKIKEDDNILLISDFYRRISDVITEEPVPYIYEKLGNRYDHFLLDEFQDTSRLQWVNLVPLLENSLSSGNRNFIVGDGKQAIYRWRNGVVEQFTSLPESVFNPENHPVLNRAAGKLIDEGLRMSLRQNFRSDENVVAFNNEFFDFCSSHLPESIRSIYADCAQTPSARFARQAVSPRCEAGKAGYAELQLFEEDDAEIEMTHITETIHRTLGAGFNYSDICILIRAKKKGAEIAQHLSLHGLPVVSDDSLLLGRDGYVRFLISLLKHLRNPEDQSLKIKSIELFARFILDMEPTSIQPEMYLPSGVTALDIFAKFGFDVHVENIHTLFNLFDGINRLISEFNMPLADNPYLQALLESAHTFSVKSGGSLRDFLRWFDETGAESAIALPDSGNAIKIMTIHKAKGLEFPVVICPFMNWKMDLHRQQTWIEDSGDSLPAVYLNMTQNLLETKHKSTFELESAQLHLDHINLLYVAFTRAKNALFISGSMKSQFDSPAKLWLIPFAKHALGDVDGSCRYHSGQLQATSRADEQPVNAVDVNFSTRKTDKPVLNFRTDPRTTRKREFGVKLHYMLAHLKDETDLRSSLNRQLKKGMITEDDAGKLEVICRSLFQNEHFRYYFKSGNKLMSEKAIVDSNGERHVPDKILFGETETCIVDFKTGQARDEDQNQVKKYILLLREMGFPSVRGELFYTDSMKMIRVE